MHPTLAAVLVAAGVFLMVKGADALVSGGSALAARYRISPMVIGLTVVSFGTSFPEFAASLVGALKGSTDIAIGNVVGSNICNIGLVLGAAALVRPVPVRAALLVWEIPMVLAATGLAWIMVGDDSVSRAEGGLLLLLFALFVAYCVAEARRGRADVPAPPRADPGTPARRALGAVAAGLVLLFAGADLLIRGAVSLAAHLGVSQAIIGLSVVALGTSLPEFATSVVALYRKEGEIGLGNVLGSNLFNLLFVLGAAALVRPAPAAHRFFTLEFPILLGFSAALLPLGRLGRSLGRRDGLLLLAGYLIYLAYLAASRHA